jgi:bromodomain and PHD finger-containing protein 1
MAGQVDLDAWLEEARTGKPPYHCPVEGCPKSYKSLQMVQKHAARCNKENQLDKTETDTEEKPEVAPATFQSPPRDLLHYTDAQKMVEFELDGRAEKFSIYDALSLVSKEDYEASLPVEMREKAEKDGEEGGEPKTPVCLKSASKKRGKARPYNTPKNLTLKQVERAMERAAAAEEKAEQPNKDLQPVDKKVLQKLPEAQYREIIDYKLPPPVVMPANYYKFVEKTPEEMDREVEYDMDEEDVAWLKLMNGRRLSDQQTKISEDQFELLMDRLEKESYFHVQTNGNSQYSAPVDDDAICCVCMDGEATNTNVILFCDLCNLAVHQECYGVPYIPEGQWLCRRCLQSPSRSVECCLCPNRGGAFKQTDDGRWAHVVCGLWIPEVRFANTVFLEPIDSIGHIPPARWKLTCRVCRQRGVGACIQCHKNSCYIAFHVTCGLLAGLHMRMETVREAGPGGTSITVRKTACCDQHTPADSDARPRLDDVAALGITTPNSKKSRSPKKAIMEQHPLPILFRGLMNFSPQCPWDKVQKIAGLVDIQKKNQFIQRLMAYWTLKRQTRNGVPLIRRLQFAKASKEQLGKLETPQKNSHHSLRSPKPGLFSDDSSKGEEEGEEDQADGKKEKREKKERKLLAPLDANVAEFKRMSEERRRMRRLRHDLERVRLLCELIRKREQRKRELLATNAEIKTIQLNPFLFFLRRVIELLAEFDTQEIFADPVDENEVPDYRDIVKKPMDFSKMREKMELFEYPSIDDFEKDFTLMVGNCLAYNERETIFYRAGTKMRDQGGSIIRQARRQAEMLGFDPETGMLTGEGPKKEEVSDDRLMKEIDEFLKDGGAREALEDEEHLKRLLQVQDKAGLIHHPVAKKKREQTIKMELQKLRRKMSIEKSVEKGGKKDKLGDLEASENAEEEEDAAVEVKKKIGRPPKDEEDDAAVQVKKKTGRPPKDEEKKKPGRPVEDKDGLKKKSSSSKDEKESSDGTVKKKAGRPPKAKKSEEKKRKRGSSDEDAEDRDETKKKRKADGDDAGEEKTKKKVEKSPEKTGVNRRNAVLFTRKKEAAKTEEKPVLKPDDEKEEDGGGPGPPEEVGRQLPSQKTDEFEFHEPSSPGPATPRLPASGRRRGRKPRRGEDSGGPCTGGPVVSVDESLFRNYRQGGGLDTDTGADSAGDGLLSTDSDDDSSSDR